MKSIEEINKLILEQEMYGEGADNISDKHHTFRELYNYRMLYNALFINECAKSGNIEVYKSKKHSDGLECFGGGWFIVTAILPTGIVDNHYKLEYWDLFKCPEIEKEKFEYDGHTPKDVSNRMLEYLKGSE